MKITVITDTDGRVLGTAPQYPEQGQPLNQFVAVAGQIIHEIDLPVELEQVRSPDEFHAALERHLATQKAE